MDIIVAKLSEIEIAAVSIIENTDVQKKEYEQKIHEERLRFDEKLSNETANAINTIKTKSQAALDQELETLKANHEFALKAFQEEYDQHHESYAAQIIASITEV